MTPARSTTLLLLVMGAAPPAFPQSPVDSRPIRRLEVTAGAGITGGGSLGSRDAALRENSLAPEPFRLFATDSRFARAAVLEARAGLALTRRYGVEGGVSFGRPELRTSVSEDVEGAPPLTVTESIAQYLVDAAAFVTLDEVRLGPVLPVVSGGIGYLRQLHEGRTVVEEGHFFHLGIGVRHWLTSQGPGLLQGSGVRADARLYLFDGGVSVDGGTRTQAAVSVGFFVVF